MCTCRSSGAELQKPRCESFGFEKCRRQRSSANERSLCPYDARETGERSADSAIELVLKHTIFGAKAEDIFLKGSV